MNNPSKTRAASREVIVSEKGFSQETLHIAKGEEVIWKVKSKKTHWPASDFHPSHGEYPEDGGCAGSKLDACRGLKDGEEFRFRFDRSGKWGIHDHLASAYTMVVIVSEKESISSDIADKFLSLFKKTSKTKDASLASMQFSENELPQALKDKCRKPKVKDDFACFAKEFEAITIKHGRDKAIDILYALQKISPRSQNCHFIAHGIGWGSYKINPQKYQESIADSSPICSYGEQMGIIEQYIGNLPEGKIGKKDIPQICGKNPKSDCNHAVGHMVLVYTKGDNSKAFDYCSIITDKLQRGYCLSGVMMEKFVEGNLREHGLKPADRSNWPLRLWEQEHFCRNQTGELEMECWREIVHPAFFYFDKDPQQMFDFCHTAPRDEIRRACKVHSIPEVAGDKAHNLKELKGMCALERGRDDGFEEQCYLQLVAMRTGFLEPDEAKDVIPFCNELDSRFQSICFRAAGPRLIQQGISTDKLQSLCRDVAPEYEGFCNGSERATPVNVHQ